MLALSPNHRQWPPRNVTVFAAIIWLLSWGVVPQAAGQSLWNFPFFKKNVEREVVCESLLNGGSTVTSQEIVHYPGVGEVYTKIQEPHANGKILRLTRAQYRELAEKEAIDPDTFLLLDEIDLEIDPPLVAGIIIQKPMPAGGTHIQMLAEKMGIPLAFAPMANFDSEFFKQPGYFSMRTVPKVIIDRSLEPMQRPQKLSVLPANFDRAGASEFVIHARSTAKIPPREIVGDKFYALARFQKLHRDLTPDIYVITAKAYEYLKRSSHRNGQTLGEYIQSELNNLKSQNEREILARIRQAILSWNQGLLEPMLKKDLPTHYARYSVRSNNDVEDLLAAGLYQSTTAEGFDQLEAAVRRVYASLYTFRAFKIRQAWGQREENLSMPVLIHEYIGNESYNGVIRFENNMGGLQMTMDLVEGSEFKATNPNHQAKALQINISEHDPVAGHSPIKHAAHKLFDEIRQTVYADIVYRTVGAKNIDLEVVFVKNKYGQLKPQVLQYKHSYDREVVLNILSGKLKREVLDEKSEGVHHSSVVDIEAVARAMNASTLSDLNLENWQNMLGSDEFRYVLIKNGETHSILIWESQRHETFKKIMAAKFPQLKWVGAGYIQLYRLSRGLINFSEPYTPTHFSREEIQLMSKPYLRSAFRDAYFAALQANGNFARSHQKFVKRVSFDTEQFQAITFNSVDFE